MQKRLILAFVIGVFTASFHAVALSNHGVILMYHHVSEQTPPSTSISAKNFTQHMQYLSEHHEVIPLEILLEKVRNHQPLPNNAIAITFDDGFANIAQNAHPVLTSFKFPYTIFINPSLIGKGSMQLTWEQVDELQEQGVTFANHTSVHKHLLLGSNEPDWLERTIADIQHAEEILVAKTGRSTKLLAYPYGEYNETLAEAIRSLGYTGFGQHSGAVSANSDFGALPRFPAAGIYANLDTLKTKLRSLDMPIIEKSRGNPQLSFSDRLPTQTAKIDTSDMIKNQLACYFQGSPLTIAWSEKTLEFTPPSVLPVGRSRVNCTAPSKSQRGRFYWFSQPWFVPTETGQWLD